MKEVLSQTIDANEIRTKYLNDCSVTTFWRLRKRPGAFPSSIKIGGLIFWDRAEVEAWYEQVKTAGGNHA